MIHLHCFFSIWVLCLRLDNFSGLRLTSPLLCPWNMLIIIWLTPLMRPQIPALQNNFCVTSLSMDLQEVGHRCTHCGQNAKFKCHDCDLEMCDDCVKTHPNSVSHFLNQKLQNSWMRISITLKYLVYFLNEIQSFYLHACQSQNPRN